MSFETCRDPYLLMHPGFCVEAKRLWQTWQFTRWPALVQAGHLFLLSHHRAALAFGGVFDSALAETSPQFGHLVAASLARSAPPTRRTGCFSNKALQGNAL
jgi:hypothetical protein